MASIIELISKDLYIEHLYCLDENSRRMRFGYPANNYAIDNYVHSISSTDIIIGIRSNSGQVMSCMHLSINRKDNLAEMGISTLADHRRKGLAESLIQYAITLLRNRNINQLYTVCLKENKALISLISKIGAVSVTQDSDSKTAIINLPSAGIDSMIDEFSNMAMVFLDRAFWPLGIKN